jgi:hypothetical protein
MMLTAAARTGLGAVRAVLRLVAGGGSHAAWWLDHNLGGSARRASSEEPERGER